MSDSLKARLRDLRVAGHFEQARAVLRDLCAKEGFTHMQGLLFEHEAYWWEPLIGRQVELRRRCAADAAFVRACWCDESFMRQFNRFARPLPRSDQDLRATLNRERAALISELHSLHWTIFRSGRPLGFVSITNHSRMHARCDFMIGFIGDAGWSTAFEATSLVADFARDRLGVERLCVQFYADNTTAARVARSFGFQDEGRLRGHLREADGTRTDVVLAGLMLDSNYRGRRAWLSWQRRAKERSGPTVDAEGQGLLQRA